MKKSYLVYAILFFVLLLILAVIQALESSDYKWHSYMSSAMNMRNMSIKLNSIATPGTPDYQELKSTAEKQLLLADKIILLQVKMKPIWSIFTTEEAEAVKAAKADLDKEH